MIQLAKTFNDKIIQIVKISDQVQFAPGTWILTCTDWENHPHKQQQFQWLPIHTRFQWVKEFLDAA